MFVGRVNKPGGSLLLCSVGLEPFLISLYGYERHTHQHYEAFTECMAV